MFSVREKGDSVLTLDRATYRAAAGGAPLQPPTNEKATTPGTV